MTNLSAFPITQKWPAQHPERLQLYSLPTPNGVKVSIMLEEIGLPYEVHLIDFGKNDQMTPEFISLSPNNKIPAILDHEVLVVSCSASGSSSGTIAADQDAFTKLVATYPEVGAMPDLDLTYILAGSFGPDAVVLQHVETRERAKCLRARGFDVPEEMPPVSLSSDLYSIYRRLDPD